MDKPLLMYLVVKGLEGKAVQIIGVGHEDSGNVSMPSSPPYSWCQSLSSIWAIFMVLDKVIDIFLPLALKKHAVVNLMVTADVYDEMVSNAAKHG